jgi:hypothetical protein
MPRWRNHAFFDLDQRPKSRLSCLEIPRHWIYYHYYYDYDDDFVWEQRTRRTRTVRQSTAQNGELIASTRDLLYGAEVKMASPTKESRPKGPAHLISLRGIRTGKWRRREEISTEETQEKKCATPKGKAGAAIWPRRSEERLRGKESRSPV